MDVSIINIFVASVEELFSTMLNCPVTLARACKANAVVAHQEIISLIGMSGALRGTVALILPLTTATSLVGRFVGAPMADDDPELTDAVAELVNIVAGSAKAKLNSDQKPINLSIPNVIRGKGQTVLAPSYATWIELAFTSELGSFKLRVTMGKS